MSNTQQNKAVNVRFMAINPTIETHIVTPTEDVSKSGDKEIVSWGKSNDYPDYLLGLYNSVSSLRSIINGCVDFVGGDDITTNAALQPNGTMNRAGDSIRDLVRLSAADFYKYGGFALQVIRNQEQKVSEIYYCDMRFLRTNPDCDIFYYSEDYAKKYTRKSNILVYPKFMPDAEHPTSIFFYKNTHTQVYPAPLYAASMLACETERSIDKYHLNSINNGFMSSLFVNFNNGVPEDEIKEQIEKDFNEKFAGADNAARIGFSWNDSKASATTFEQFKLENFGDQYNSLAKHCRQQIFTAFRATPNLFGIPTDSLGFSSEEYEAAFKLFYRTQIIPTQRTIVDAFDRILGVKDSVTIAPFTLTLG